MRGLTLWSLWWAGMAATTLSAETPLSRLPRVSLNGQDYVSASDWGRANQFAVSWSRSQEEVSVTNHWASLTLTPDSRRITLNGVDAWLSWPVIKHGSQVYVSAMDLRTAIHPILYPVKTRSGRPIQTICLDPGHGGKDPGNEEGRTQEKRLTLALALELRNVLTNAGFKVTFTRTTDEFIDLEDRPRLAQRSKADLFLSLHCNAAPTPTVQGAEVYCLTPARASSTNARGEGANTGSYPGNRLDDHNMLLAYLLQRRLVRDYGADDRGLHRARFAVLRPLEVPGVLIESAFMSHKDDLRRLNDPARRRQLAQAIVDGLLDYMRKVDSGSPRLAAQGKPKARPAENRKGTQSATNTAVIVPTVSSTKTNLPPTVNTNAPLSDPAAPLFDK